MKRIQTNLIAYFFSSVYVYLHSMTHLPEKRKGPLLTRLLGSLAQPVGPLWLKLEDAHFLILRKFDASTSSILRSALTSRPDTFIFNDDGNISCVADNGTTKTYRHANTATDTFPVSGNSIKDLQRASEQYVYSVSRVISRNLKFLLVDVESRYYILYNPLHRAEFRDYYNQSIELGGPNGNVSWGATTIPDENHIDLQRILESYCSALVVQPHGTVADDERAYLDPTCKMFLGAIDCQIGSVMNKNRVMHPAHQVAALEPIWRMMGSSSSQESIPNCVCMGSVYNTINANLDGSNSFMLNFKNMTKCDPNIVYNTCTNIVQGNNVTMAASSLANQCGYQPTSSDDDAPQSAATSGISSQLGAASGTVAKNINMNTYAPAAYTNSAKPTFGGADGDDAPPPEDDDVPSPFSIALSTITSNSPLLIGLLTIMLLFIIGVFFYVRRSTNSAQPQPPASYKPPAPSSSSVNEKNMATSTG